MMNSSQILISSVGAAAAASPAIYQQSQWSSHLTAPPSPQANLGGAVLACVLSFLAAAVSSAGGVGGGSLYVPILSVVAGLVLKTAVAFSTFMVTRGTLSNVLCTLFLRRGCGDRQPLIDYGIAVVSQPCLLLGVSAGVVCNVVSPQWLITALFSLFLAFATVKTYRTGVRRWRAETAELGGAAAAEVEPLLGRNGGGRRCQWVDLLVLVTVWLCFFAMHLFIGGDGAKVRAELS